VIIIAFVIVKFLKRERKKLRMQLTDEKAPPPWETQGLPLVPCLSKRAYLLQRHVMRIVGDKGNCFGWAGRK
jgi:hypothetical protein